MLGKQGMTFGAGLPALGLLPCAVPQDYGIEHRQSAT
jgi:hypothetical protein